MSILPVRIVSVLSKTSVLDICDEIFVACTILRIDRIHPLLELGKLVSGKLSNDNTLGDNLLLS